MYPLCRIYVCFSSLCRLPLLTFPVVCCWCLCNLYKRILFAIYRSIIRCYCSVHTWPFRGQFDGTCSVCPSVLETLCLPSPPPSNCLYVYIHRPPRTIFIYFLCVLVSRDVLFLYSISLACKVTAVGACRCRCNCPGRVAWSSWVWGGAKRNHPKWRQRRRNRRVFA